MSSDNKSPSTSKQDGPTLAPKDTEPKVSKKVGRGLDSAEDKAENAVDKMKEKEREVKAKAKKFAEEHDMETMMKKGFVDFKNVFLYPLLTGVMTGVGFIAGKKMAEAYFYPQASTVVVTAPKTI